MAMGRPPNWVIERAQEYVVPLPADPGSIKQFYGPYPKFSRNYPQTREERRQNRRAYDKRYSEKRKELGLCQDCKNEAMDGKVRCSECADKRRQMKHRLYRRDRQNESDDQVTAIEGAETPETG